MEDELVFKIWWWLDEQKWLKKKFIAKSNHTRNLQTKWLKCCEKKNVRTKYRDFFFWLKILKESNGYVFNPLFLRHDVNPVGAGGKGFVPWIMLYFVASFFHSFCLLLEAQWLSSKKLGFRTGDPRFKSWWTQSSYFGIFRAPPSPPSSDGTWQ